MYNREKKKMKALVKKNKKTENGGSGLCCLWCLCDFLPSQSFLGKYPEPVTQIFVNNPCLLRAGSSPCWTALTKVFFIFF